MSILNSFAQGGRLRLTVRAEGYPKLSKPAPVVKFKVRECMASVLTHGLLSLVAPGVLTPRSVRINPYRFERWP